MGKLKNSQYKQPEKTVAQPKLQLYAQALERLEKKGGKIELREWVSRQIDEMVSALI